MSVVELELHLIQVEHNVVPSHADRASQFGLGNAPEILYLGNVAAVTVGEHLRVQNQAVAIIVTKQRGTAPESIRTNRAATRDLLPDNLPQHHPHYIWQWFGVHTPLPIQEPKQYKFMLHSSAHTDG